VLQAAALDDAIDTVPRARSERVLQLAALTARRPAGNYDEVTGPARRHEPAPGGGS
jgi:hypothetical protein